MAYRTRKCASRRKARRGGRTRRYRRGGGKVSDVFENNRPH